MNITDEKKLNKKLLLPSSQEGYYDTYGNISGIDVTKRVETKKEQTLNIL